MAKAGFTLVELSIVIVIIGLVIAGVTAGQGLVQQAKLRTIITDINKYTSAYNAFKLQYNAVPGDMANASSYWTAAVSGNGNRLIDNGGGEDFKAWDHLAKAGLIQGNYTGALSGGLLVANVNAPPGSVSNSAYLIMSQAGWGSIYGKGYNENGLRLGKPSGPYNNVGVLSGVNAASIDAKFDDGLASRGNFVAVISGYGAVDGIRCVTGTVAGAAGSSNYIMTDNAATSCSVQYWIGK